MVKAAIRDEPEIESCCSRRSWRNRPVTALLSGDPGSSISKLSSVSVDSSKGMFRDSA